MVIEFGLSLEDAWGATLHEFLALSDVKRKARVLVKTKQGVQTRERIDELEQHLREIGAL